jgi:hypothetical protein
MNVTEFELPQDGKNANGPKISVVGHNSFVDMMIGLEALQKSARKRQKAPFLMRQESP